MKTAGKILFFLLFPSFIFLLVTCGPGEEKKSEQVSTYLNLGDSATYVGKEKCMLCHQDKYNTFIHTGMGQSFDAASKKKSSAKFGDHIAIYDKYADFWYHPFWDGDSLKIMEFRLDGKDTVYKRVEKVDYIIGSGQHTNSHIFSTNGYLHQMPMTFYTQEGRWDLPPGFEKGFNSRFSRKIGLECMSCHNSLPDFVPGSENKFFSVPNGISCERCHGPGSVHVRMKEAGIRVDTSKAIDYSIVNPGKLPIDLQFDVCQRCHLQGNSVLKDGKSFYDFKPGMKLSSVMTTFLPKYKNAEDEFIMASHADRLKMSQCFIKSFRPADSKDSLRPYKSALTCVTCHNPHVSVKFTDKEVFNNACKNCHGGKTEVVCTEKEVVRAKVQDNCVSCHMPKSGSIDIPHVRVTDHYIRKPEPKPDVQKIKEFIGLCAINEKNPSHYTMAKAYLNQFEKFDNSVFMLDSAKKYLPEETEDDVRNNFSLLVRYYFLKNDFEKILSLTTKVGQSFLLVDKLVNKSWDNDDAWACYRIGEAYSWKNQPAEALKFYTQADKLAPFNPEFKNKLGAAMVAMGNPGGAKPVFEKIISEDSKFAPAWSNLGYIYLLQNNIDEGEKDIRHSLSLDPDNEKAMLNMAQVFLLRGKKTEAVTELKSLLKKHPDSQAAKDALKQMANN